MRYLPFAEIKEGMLLGRNIYGNDGRVLLVKGAKLTKTYLQKLKEMNYTHLYVGEKEEDLEFKGPISDQTYSEAIAAVREVLLRAAKDQNLGLKTVLDVVDFMVDEVVEEDVLFNIIDLKNHNNYTYLHSVNVSIISTIMGKVLGLNRNKLKELAAGALLHDIGKVFIENTILEKTEDLSYQEYEKMMFHSKYGFDLLREIPELSLLSAHVAYQHHEREDGSGYPRALNGEEIHLYAKITMVADSYDAMTSGRSYRRVLWSHEAIEELISDAPQKYDLKVVMALTKSVALYPIGSVVLLNNLEVAIVSDVSTKKIRIQLLTGEKKGEVIELFADSLLKIERRLS